MKTKASRVTESEGDLIHPSHLEGSTLPNNWEWVSLGSICRTTSGGTPSRKNKEYFEGDIPWVKSGELPDGPISEIEEYITEEAVKNSSAKPFPKGTLLIALYGATVGKLGILNNEAATNQAVCAIFPPEQLETKYLFWYLRFVRSDLIAQAIGGAQPNISQGILRNRLIPVAPPEQQKSIIAEIEKQFSRLDEAVANLKRIKANLKRYKAAVLKAAVEGKLTEAWRLSARAKDRRRAQASELEAIPKAGKDKWFIYIIECDDGSYYVGHTGDLHDRWQRHCEGSAADWTRQHVPKYLVHYEAWGSREEAVKREKDLKTGFGRTWRKREIDAGRIKPLVHNPANETALPVHDEDMQTGTKLLDRILTKRRANWKGKGKYKEPSSPGTTGLHELPKRWIWASLDQLLLKITDGDHQPPPQTDSGVPFLVIGNVRSGKLDFEDTRFVSQEYADSVDTYRKPTLGDILYSLVGSYGIALFVNTKREFCIQRHIGILRPHQLSPTPYLVHALNSPFVFKQATAVATGTAQKTVPLAGLRRLAIPLPPFDELGQNVSEVERRLSVIDELEATVEANLTRADRLRLSILGKAFSGQLVKPNSSLPSKIA